MELIMQLTTVFVMEVLMEYVMRIKCKLSKKGQCRRELILALWKGSEMSCNQNHTMHNLCYNVFLWCLVKSGAGKHQWQVWMIQNRLSCGLIRWNKEEVLFAGAKNHWHNSEFSPPLYIPMGKDKGTQSVPETTPQDKDAGFVLELFVGAILPNY